LFERRHRRPLLIDQHLLLRRIELGGGTGLQALAYQLEHARRAGNVLPCDLKPVLRRQHLEISVRCGDHGRERDHFAVKSGRDRGLLGRPHRGAVLAPEVDLVAGAKRRLIRFADAFPAGRSGSGRVERALAFCRVEAEADRGQKGGAGDAGLRVGLNNARHRGGDIEVGLARLLDDVGELAGAKRAPPIKRRQCGMRGTLAARSQHVALGDIDRRLRLVGEQTAGERQGDRDRPQRRSSAPRRKPDLFKQTHTRLPADEGEA
jgi:hypothetical protein